MSSSVAIYHDNARKCGRSRKSCNSAPLSRYCRATIKTNIVANSRSLAYQLLAIVCGNRLVWSGEQLPSYRQLSIKTSIK